VQGPPSPNSGWPRDVRSGQGVDLAGGAKAPLRGDNAAQGGQIRSGEERVRETCGRCVLCSAMRSPNAQGLSGSSQQGSEQSLHESSTWIPRPACVAGDRCRAPWQALRVPADLLVIDNYDSFTHNVADLLTQLGASVAVARNDETTVAA